MQTLTPVVGASLGFAKTLFTRGTDCFGLSEVNQVFRINLNPESIPPIPFSEAELKRARELGQYLILQINTAKDGESLTMKKIHNQFDNKLGDGKLLYDTDWYAKEPFFTEDIPGLGWKLVSREVIPGSMSKDYIGQTKSISDYLVNEVYEGEELPDVYQVAVDEFKNRKAELEELRDSDWKKCAEELVGLRLNILFREKPVEVLYSLIVQHEINHERLLSNTYTWTSVRSSNGNLVNVGNCDSNGVNVDNNEPRNSNDNLGVRFSRSVYKRTLFM